ncbi:extracellular solute-binding protein [Cohnella cellulosilytica]|uniref:Extracellular solute-binding protein n=1 Tax=Cohnella cellulosilytica TaxID=986710 RepID=A0ABW2FB18_9BACL
MSTWKRARDASLALAVAAAALAGCSGGKSNEEGGAANASGSASKAPVSSGFPIVEEPIALKVFSRLDPQLKPYEEMYLFKEMEAKTNIRIQWDSPAITAAGERLNLLMSSNDMPDVILKSNASKQQISSFAAQGQLLPLDEYLDYAPNVTAILDANPEVRQAITSPDGHIYFLPTVYDYDARNVGRYPLINVKWLDKLKLSAPTTSDELLDVLRAFKSGDPNGNGQPDEIPYNAHTIDMAMIGIQGMFGLDQDIVGGVGFGANVEDGKVNLWADDDRFRDALHYFKQLYDEGLVDPEIFTQDDKLYFGKLADGRIGYTPLYQPRNAGEYAQDYDAITPIKGPSGDQLWPFLNFKASTIAFVMTKNNKYPEASMRWADYFYTDEGATLMYLGKEGETYDKQADGTMAYRKEILESSNGFENEMGKWTMFPGGGELGYYQEKHIRPTMEGTPMSGYIEKVRDYLPANRYSEPMMDPALSERYTQIMKDLGTYVKEMRAKFVLGNESFDKWDEYVRQLDRIGIKEAEQILTEQLGLAGQ